MADKHCPLYKEPCHEHKCRWYIQLLGKNPQTGADISDFGCAIEWLPVLMIEQSKEVRQTAAAVESFRNVNASMAHQIVDGFREVVVRMLPRKD